MVLAKGGGRWEGRIMLDILNSLMGKNYAWNQNCTFASNTVLSPSFEVSPCSSWEWVDWWFKRKLWRCLSTQVCAEKPGGNLRPVFTLYKPHTSIKDPVFKDTAGDVYGKNHIVFSFVCVPERDGHVKWLRSKLGWVTPERCWPFLLKTSNPHH